MLTTHFSLFTASTKRYRKVSLFACAIGSVNTLALSTDGQIIAAGGAKGIQLWNLETRKELAPVTHLETRGVVSCATWMKTKHIASETLCYGTGMGYLVFLQSTYMDNQYHDICAQRLGSGFEITCIAWDAVSSDSKCQIVVGTRDNMVQVLTFSSASQLQSIFAGRLDSTVPKSVAFGEPGTFYVFGLYDGIVVKVNSKDGAVIAEHRCQSSIGCAAVNQKKGIFVVDNTTDGFTLYRLESGQAVRTFPTGPTSVPVSKQVTFGEEGKVVIGGSDNGCVYVFNRRTGELIEMLHHTSTTLVQTITVRDVGGQCIVACASPAIGRKKSTVSVWKYGYDARKAPSPTYSLWQVLMGFSALVVIAPLMLLAMQSCHSATQCRELYRWTLASMTWSEIPTIDVSSLYHFAPAPTHVAHQDSEALREEARREKTLREESLREEALQNEALQESALRELALEVVNLIVEEYELGKLLHDATEEVVEDRAGAEEPVPSVIVL